MSMHEHTREEMLAQTARLGWNELERPFARGVVIGVDGGMDLVEVAACFANDDKTAVEGWITAGKIEHLGLKTARDWAARDPDLWAVVVAPWVLVQERSE